MIELEGGCRVTGLKEGEPERDGDLLIWRHFQSVLSLRVLELHGRAVLRNEDLDEVLFVLGEERSIYLPAGSSEELKISFRCSQAMPKTSRNGLRSGQIVPMQARMAG